MAEKPIPTATVVLNCEHRITLTVPLPDPGAVQYCERCVCYRKVESIPDKWETKCLTRRGCYHTVSNSEALALRRANGHIKSSRHVMVVRHKGRAVHKWEPVEGWYQPWHPPIPESQDPPS